MTRLFSCHRGPFFSTDTHALDSRCCPLRYDQPYFTPIPTEDGTFGLSWTHGTVQQSHGCHLAGLDTIQQADDYLHLHGELAAAAERRGAL